MFEGIEDTAYSIHPCHFCVNPTKHAINCDKLDFYFLVRISQKIFIQLLGPGRILKEKLLILFLDLILLVTEVEIHPIQGCVLVADLGPK